jgi:polysaccharide deacetylase 2 family uncharacterized protein YibQ
MTSNSTPMFRFVLFFALVVLTTACHSNSGVNATWTKPSDYRVAIIIDDLGYDLKLGKQAIKLPGPVTLSIIPDTPHSSTVANLATSENKEIMLHLPMTNTSGKKLEPYALHENMKKQEFMSLLDRLLDSIPQASGVNNHMGSLLTQKAEPMNWLMQGLKKKGLFFIDSRTTPDSRALEAARNHQVPSLSRNVFIDLEQDKNYIEEQLEKLIELAKQQGHAIGIGHPSPLTYGVLRKQIPHLRRKGIQLVPVSELLKPAAVKQASLPEKPSSQHTGLPDQPDA